MKEPETNTVGPSNQSTSGTKRGRTRHKPCQGYEGYNKPFPRRGEAVVDCFVLLEIDIYDLSDLLEQWALFCCHFSVVLEQADSSVR